MARFIRAFLFVAGETWMARMRRGMAHKRKEVDQWLPKN